MDKISIQKSTLEGIYSAMKSDLQGFLSTENNWYGKIFPKNLKIFLRIINKSLMKILIL